MSPSLKDKEPPQSGAKKSLDAETRAVPKSEIKMRERYEKLGREDVGAVEHWEPRDPRRRCTR